MTIDPIRLDMPLLLHQRETVIISRRWLLSYGTADTVVDIETICCYYQRLSNYRDAVFRIFILGKQIALVLQAQIVGPRKTKARPVLLDL